MIWLLTGQMNFELCNSTIVDCNDEVPHYEKLQVALFQHFEELEWKLFADWIVYKHQRFSLMNIILSTAKLQ